MKTKKNIFFIAMTLFFAFASCSKDDDNNTTPNPNPINGGGGNLGTFSGYLQITDDPQTNLGYVYNTKITVSTSGSSATIKITGNDGFNREFTGDVFASTSTSTLINIKKQTKPVEKVAGSNLVIDNNILGLQITLASDKVTVRETTTSTATEEIAGKINMLGSDLLRE